MYFKKTSANICRVFDCFGLSNKTILAPFTQTRKPQRIK